MAGRRAPPALVVSCLCALVALALMSWQLFDPHVFPIIVAMSVGQIVGTASFAAYLYVVYDDFRRQRSSEKKARKINGG